MKRKHGSDAVLPLFWRDLVLASILIYAPLQSSWAEDSSREDVKDIRF
jgi:hypothetical protein